MKLVCISDTHSLQDDVILPDGDILLCAGDITNNGDLRDVSAFARWVKSYQFKHYITIAGNHDWCFQRSYQKEEARQILKDSGITYLEDQELVIDGIKFYGAPWQPEFCHWAFNLRRGEELAKKWSNISDDTNVLITHGPPSNILDLCEYDQVRVGCEDLSNRIKKLKKLKVHLFGHIHETYGVQKVKKVIYVNASICTLRYNPTNKPIVIDID